MRLARRVVKRSLVLVLGTGLLAAGCGGMAPGRMSTVMLSGSQEVPPVTTSASGTSTITVGMDRTVTGEVTTRGMTGVAGHLHQGAMGQNGPVIITLTKKSDNVWSVPAGTRLTEAQYEAFKAGNLYINIHSAAHKDGEIRAQLKP
jgi:CHRD domain